MPTCIWIGWPPDTSMTPSGIITTTTDFGHRGPFTAIMKGVILGRFPDARVVDLIHDIPAQWPPEAGFWVSAAYRYFPAGTLHLAIVDPGVGTERGILIADCDGHRFMAPDNGLLARLLSQHPDADVYRLNNDVLERLGLGTPSSTFHGRDIFAPVAAELAAGRIQPGDIATQVDEWIPDWIDEPQVEADHVSGVIVTIDTFGNLISNIEKDWLERFSRPRVQFAGLTLSLVETYGRVTPGDYLALINSFDVLEIARAEGHASKGLGAERGAPIRVVNAAD